MDLAMYCLVGLVVVGALWIFTRTQETRKEPVPNVVVPRGFTAAELANYTGENGTVPYVSVKGTVFAVSREFYGPGNAYNAFAGVDASRHLGKVRVGRDECNADWTTLSFEHLQVLDEWEERFRAKYMPVGWFIPDASYYAKAKTLDP